MAFFLSLYLKRKSSSNTTFWDISQAGGVADPLCSVYEANPTGSRVGIYIPLFERCRLAPNMSPTSLPEHRWLTLSNPPQLVTPQLDNKCIVSRRFLLTFSYFLRGKEDVEWEAGKDVNFPHTPLPHYWWNSNFINSNCSLWRRLALQSKLAVTKKQLWECWTRAVCLRGWCKFHLRQTSQCTRWPACRSAYQVLFLFDQHLLCVSHVQVRQELPLSPLCH